METCLGIEPQSEMIRMWILVEQCDIISLLLLLRKHMWFLIWSNCTVRLPIQRIHPWVLPISMYRKIWYFFNKFWKSWNWLEIEASFHLQSWLHSFSSLHPFCTRIRWLARGKFSCPPKGFVLSTEPRPNERNGYRKFDNMSQIHSLKSSHPFTQNQLSNFSLLPWNFVYYHHSSTTTTHRHCLRHSTPS